MKMRLPSREEFRMLYARDLQTAFPADELKPLGAMEQLWDAGLYRPWCMVDGDEIVGCALVWEAEPGWVLFDYLCVSAPRRCDGIGSELIRQLLTAERGSVLFGESEIAAYASDPVLSARRNAFYIRNGAKRAYYDTALFGVPYHTFYWSDTALDEKELLKKHRAAYCSRLGEKAYERFIRIPWDESMGMPERVAWEENP